MELLLTNDNLTKQGSHKYKTIADISIRDFAGGIKQFFMAEYVRFVDEKTRACKVLKDRYASREMWLNETLSQSNWALNVEDYRDHPMFDQILKMLDAQYNNALVNPFDSRFLLMHNGFASIATVLPDDTEVLTLKEWCERNGMKYEIPLMFLHTVQHMAAYALIGRFTFGTLVEHMNKLLGTKISPRIEDNTISVKWFWFFGRKETKRETTERIARYADVLAQRLLDRKSAEIEAKAKAYFNKAK